MNDGFTCLLSFAPITGWSWTLLEGKNTTIQQSSPLFMLIVNWNNSIGNFKAICACSQKKGPDVLKDHYTEASYLHWSKSGFKSHAWEHLKPCPVLPLILSFSLKPQKLRILSFSRCKMQLPVPAHLHSRVAIYLEGEGEVSSSITETKQDIPGG